MKKMVCEICESMSIRKVDGIFVCQDCGTEYSLEDAKKLLKDVDETPVVQEVKNIEVKVVKNNENKFTLLEHLFAWLKVLSVFEDCNFWIGTQKEFNISNLTTSEVDFNNFIKVINVLEPRNFYDLTFNDLRDSLNYRLSAEKMFFFWEIYGDKSFETKIRDNFKFLSNYFKFVDKSSLGSEIEIGYSSRPKYYFYDKNKNKYMSFEELYTDVNMNSIVLDMAFNMSNYVFFQNSVVKLSFLKSMVKNSSHEVVSNQILIPNELKESLDNCKAFVDQLLLRHRTLKDFYFTNFKDVKKTYVDAIETILSLEEKFNLPFKYRKVEYIIELIDIIVGGRADNWKEAANIFSFEKFAQNVALGFKDLSNKLDTISNQLRTISSQLSTINSELRILNDNTSKMCFTMFECRQVLTNIMYDTRFNLIWK